MLATIMNRIIVILITILPIIVLGQKTLEGKYCSPKDFIGFCIRFNKDSTFTYTSWSCLSDNIGTGIYKIHLKKLILKFDSTENYIASKHVNKKIEDQDRDSIKLIFNVLDVSDSTKLPFANILISENEYKYYGDSIDFVRTTDISGIAEIKLLKQNIDKWITVTFVTYNSYSFKINLMNSQNIGIYLSPHNFGRIENEIYTYDIKKKHKNKIIIVDKELKGKLVLKKIK